VDDHALIAIWATVLKTEVTHESDFFHLGGDSLKAIELCAAIEVKFGVQFTLENFYSCKTLKAQSNKLTEKINEKKRLSSATEQSKNIGDESNSIPFSKKPDSHFFSDQDYLTSFQQQIYVHQKRYPDSAVFNLPYALKISGEFDLKLYQQAWQKILNSEKLFQSVVLAQGDTVSVQICDANNFEHFKIETISSESPEQTKKILTELSRKKIDFNQAPLLQTKIILEGSNEVILFFNFHHIIFDDFSFDLFCKKLFSIYKILKASTSELTNDADSRVGTSVTTIFDYIRKEKLYKESSHYYQDREFWKEQFNEGCDLLNIPYISGAEKKSVAPSNCLQLKLGSDYLEKLHTFCHIHTVTPANVFFTVLQLSLYRFCENTDLITAFAVQTREDQSLLCAMGPFINTLPIRTKINPELSLIDFIQHTQQNFFTAYQHRKFPFFEIFKNAPVPFEAKSFYTHLDVRERKTDWGHFQIEDIFIAPCSVYTEIDLLSLLSNDCLQLFLNYNSELLNLSTMRSFLELYQSILDLILQASCEEIKTLQIKDIELSLKQQQTLMLWGTGPNQNESSDLKNTPYFNVFKAIESRFTTNKNKIAVSSSTGEISYGQILAISNQIVAALQASGLRYQAKVGICLNRDHHLPVVVFSLMRHGYIYVPLDPALPQARLSALAEKAELQCIISESSLSNLFGLSHKKMLLIENILQHPITKIAQVPFPADNDIAYMIYTSGSTGFPKAVQIEHKSLTNFLVSMQKYDVCVENDRLLALTSVSFDISILELLLPLLTGASIFISDKKEFLDAQAFSQLIYKNKISLIQATPSFWNILILQKWQPSAKLKILSGGEKLTPEIAKFFLSNNCKLLNMYGPTETTIWSSFAQVHDSENITVGRPIHNTQFFILNKKNKLSATGNSGELFIGGVGLSCGYFQDARQTDAKFFEVLIQDQRHRLYATGDMARWTEDGQLLIFGRQDRQIKINGYRIELQEIQSHLLNHSSIRESYVFVNQKFSASLIVAAVVLKKHTRNFDRQSLNSFLESLLPSYMLPQQYIFIENMPLNNSGKVDENTLKDIFQQNARSVTESAPPKADFNSSSEKIELLRSLWKKRLKKSEITDADQFFNIGGDSILALHTTMDVENTFNIQIPLSLLIEATSFQAFAKKIISLENSQKNALTHPSEKSQPNLHTNFSSSSKTSDLDSANKFQSLIELQKGSDEMPPIICFHAVGGHVLNYNELLKCVPENRAVFALQSEIFTTRKLKRLSIENMVRNYLSELEKVIPPGPYILCGGSMGGTLAFEAAVQLLQTNQSVHKIILFDTFGPEIDIREYDLQTSSQIRKFVHKIQMGLTKTKFSIMNFFYQVLNKELTLENLAAQIQLQNYEALLHYRTSTYLGDIYLIRSHTTSSGIYKDPYLGWRQTVKGKINVFEINAEHDTFLENPDFKKIFADLIQQRM